MGRSPKAKAINDSREGAIDNCIAAAHNGEVGSETVQPAYASLWLRTQASPEDEPAD